MNIFFVDQNPTIAARQICNVHVNKMIIESCQMLSTAHHLIDGESDGLMKPTHKNHPCNIWVRSSKQNYEWLVAYTKELFNVYTKRSGKIHKCERERISILKNAPKGIPNKGFELPPACMPDEVKRVDVAASYKAYLNIKYAEWLNRERPMKVEFTYEKPNWLNL